MQVLFSTNQASAIRVWSDVGQNGMVSSSSTWSARWFLRRRGWFWMRNRPQPSWTLVLCCTDNVHERTLWVEQVNLGHIMRKNYFKICIHRLSKKMWDFSIGEKNSDTKLKLRIEEGHVNFKDTSKSVTITISQNRQNRAVYRSKNINQLRELPHGTNYRKKRPCKTGKNFTQPSL